MNIYFVYRPDEKNCWPQAVICQYLGVAYDKEEVLATKELLAYEHNIEAKNIHALLGN